MNRKIIRRRNWEKGSKKPIAKNLTSNETQFIKELDNEIFWEWKWEKRHRMWSWGINWASWVTRLFLLALGWYQITSKNTVADQSWVILVIAFLAMFNIALPLLSFTFRFQQRQEVHDSNAREYSAIRVEFLSGQLTLADAVHRFTEHRRKPTERVIRLTP